MIKNFRKICWRSLWVCIETLAVVAILLGLVTGVAVWTLRAGPVDIGFAKEYIQSALSDPVRGTHATMDHVVLHWPDLSGPLLLGMQNGKILSGEGHVIASVEEVALALSKRYLLIGRIMPEALIVRRPHLRLVRKQDGGFDVGLDTANNVYGPVVPDKTDLAGRLLEYIAHPGRESDTSPLASLKSLEIENAKLSIEDRIIQETWVVPVLNAQILSGEEALTGRISAQFEQPPVSAGQEHQTFGLRAEFSMPWQTRQTQVKASLEQFDLSSVASKFPALDVVGDFDIPVSMSLEASLNESLVPISAEVKIDSQQGAVSLPEFYDDPLEYRDFSARLKYQNDPRMLSLQSAQITARDVTVGLKAEIDLSPQRIAGPLRLEIDQVDHAKLGPLWPKFLLEDSSHEWIIEKLSAGAFQNAYAGMDVLVQKTDQNWEVNFENLKAGFEFADMEIDYRAPLMPATKARGKGLFDYEADTLTIDVEEAMIADLKVSKALILLDEVVAVGTGGASIDLGLSGPLKTVFEYVAREPISQTQDFSLDGVGGQADLSVGLKFPLSDDIKIDEFEIAVTGKLNETSIDNVTSGLDFSGGNLDLSVEDNAFNLSGKGILDGAEIDLSYDGFVKSEGQDFRRKLTAEFVIDRAMRQKLGVDIDWLLDGNFPVRIVHTNYNDKPSVVDVKADLGPGRVMIDPFKYEKTRGEKGSASLSAIIDDGRITEVNNLVAEAPNLKLENTTLMFIPEGDGSALHIGQISRFHIGETIARMNFEFEPSGRIKVVLDGPFLDLRPFLGADESQPEGPPRPEEVETNPPMLISVSADRMRPSDGQTVEYGKIFVDIDGQGRFNQLELDAIAGAGDVYLRYKPDESGMRVFRFEADDAGATLKAFGVYDKIQGGTMEVYAEPIKSVYDRNLVGVAEINNFKIVRAPAFAKLLSAMSLPGMINLLNDEGLTFTRLKSDFNWLYRPQGGLVLLKNGRTSGNSLGLTFDGKFDNAQSYIDVEGTIVPLSTVNKIISKIPLVGDILTGGSGAVFAATYDVEGDAKDPDISVNPLAVLAPGILRRILFEQN